jgi:hypothetical protein
LSQNHYTVERDIWGPAHAEIALVRRPASRGAFSRLRRHADQKLVLHARTFKPRVEAEQLERYAAKLELVARHANEGTLGCFLDTQPRAGTVEITLYERWFDGQHLHCEKLASRTFDASDEETLVASAEFVAELESWAEQLNDQRELDDAEARVETEARALRALERDSAAQQLARILNRD